VKKNSILIGLGVLIVLIFVGNAAHYYRIGFISQLSNVLYDYRLQLTMPGGVDDRIVILDIDEKSLKEEGRWPWGRNRLGLLMDKLFDQYGVVEVGFDVVFAEKDDSSGIKVLQQLSKNQLKSNVEFQTVLTQISPQFNYDQLFASKIQNRKVILGYYLSNQNVKSSTGQLPDSTFPAGIFKQRPITFFSCNSYGANLPELQNVAAAAGHFSPLVDADGVIRRVPMLAEYNGEYYESLSLAMVHALFEDAHLALGFAESNEKGYGGLEWLALEEIKIPVDSNVAAYVPYRGKQGSFKYISVTDVLHDRVDPALLKDKIVLVGTTAPGLLDMRTTPVGSVYPGVEVHANLIAGMLDQNLKSYPSFMLGVEVVWLLLSGVIYSLVMPRLSPVKAMLGLVVTITITLGMSLFFWQYANVLMPVANSLVMIVLLFVLKTSYGYFIESRTKRQITNLFGQYVPSELVEEMSQNPSSVSMEGESREMTILFSDVRGFTTISEGLSPKELTLLMNEFLTPLSRIVYKHRGTIDKYMGDCIMAFWGAPLPDVHHARNAIIAGLEMLSTLETLQPHFKARGWPEIHIGVGLNTGRVSVGNMGSEVRVAYTVMGDEVNLASRLEGITKQYGVGIIVGENTKDLVTDFVYRNLDDVRVKGKDKPVTIYEPIGLMSEVSQILKDEVELFHEVRRLYAAQDWDGADLRLKRLRNMSHDTKLYGIYSKRIAYFRTNPPTTDWDGVYVFQTK
jgi:adenylate cyclase